MRLLLLIAINLHTHVSSRKHASSSEDESIENLLYYRDCKHSTMEPPTTEAPEEILSLKGPKQQPDCPFPKMCCSMSCGNDCGSNGNQESFVSRQMEPLQNLQPIQPRSPSFLQRNKKKHLNNGMNMQLPFRRDFGFTKEKIKGLISQDQDIRKILRDLVRVTMQKVDLMEMLKNRRNNVAKNSDTSLNSGDDDSYVQ